MHCGCGNEREKSFLPFPAESTIPPVPINWLVNTFSLWFFPSLTCKVLLHSHSLLRVRQPFVVLDLFFWSGKKLPFASVRMFLPSTMGKFLPFVIFRYEWKSKWQKISHSRNHWFFTFAIHMAIFYHNNFSSRKKRLPVICKSQKR